jgi:predicted nucleic acid-binding protein
VIAAVLDSGALSALAEAERRMVALAEATQRVGGVLLVPAVVLAEATTGVGTRDAKVNRVLKKTVIDSCDEKVARRAAALRHGARVGRGKAIDAIVIATAEASPRRTVITGDPKDLRTLAAHADNVRVLDYRDVPPT